MHPASDTPRDAVSPGTPPCHGGRLLLTLLLFAWATAVVLPPAMFLNWRQGRLAELSRPAAQADWDLFRDAMRGQAGRDGPVQRKVPRSDEPPELVWLRDYPALAVTAWVVLVGVLGGFLAVLARGAARSGPPRVACPDGTGSTAQDQPGRRGDGEKQDERDAQHADEREHDSSPRSHDAAAIRRSAPGDRR